MSFINPFFLYLLPLAIIPLLIHLIGRQRYYRQEFSTLRFLKQLESDLIRKLKIRQILLLILRILLIILLVLIFARPYRSTRSPGIYVGKGETLFLLLDNSLSMQGEIKGRNQLERGTSGIINAAGEIDYPIYIKLIETTKPSVIRDFGLVTGPNEFGQILAGVEVTNRAGDINRALQTIRENVGLHQELNPAVWIASDFQESDFRVNASLKYLIKEIHCRLICFPVNPVQENAGIVSISVPGQLFRRNQSVLVRGTMCNWNSEEREVPVSLFLDDQKLGQALLNVPALEENFVSFEFIPSFTGIQHVRMQIAADALMADNQQFFTLNISEQIRVLIVTQNPENGRFINRALQADKPLIITTKLTSTGLFPTENLENYDLLIFSNVDELSANAQTKLDFYLKMNRGILLFPGNDCTPDRFNALWADGYGFPKWRTTRNAEAGQYLKLGDFDENHPVFNRLLRKRESIVYSPQFYKIPGFSPGKNQQTIGLYEDNTPFIIETTMDDGRGILVASSPVAGWSNLHLTGYFPAILNRLVIYLTQQGAIQPELYCGDTLSIPLTQLNIQSDLVVHTPDDRRIMLPLRTHGPVLFEDTDLPGFYGIYSGGRHVREYAVNIPQSETSARFLSGSEFEELITDIPGKLDVFFIGEENELQQLEQSREFNDWLIVLALAVALLESYIGRINRKNRTKLQNG